MDESTSTKVRAEGVERELNELLQIYSSLAYEKKVGDVYLFPIDLPLEKKDLQELGISVDVSNAKTIFHKTLAMRHRIKEELNPQGKLDSIKRNKVAKWIVEDWGGITSAKANKLAVPNQSSLANVIGKAVEGKYDFNRIASWSKYLAFKDPEQFAIYDARVIYSLNWLLFKSGANRYFPFPNGRNSVMGLLNYELFLFLQSPESRELASTKLEDDIKSRRGDKSQGKANSLIKKSSFVRNLKKQSDLFIKESDAFSKYCDLLKDISTGLFGNDADRLTKTEMLLFSIADAEIAESVLKYVTAHIPSAATVSP